LVDFGLENLPSDLRVIKFFVDALLLHVPPKSSIGGQPIGGQLESCYLDKSPPEKVKIWILFHDCVFSEPEFLQRKPQMALSLVFLILLVL
jgi:hypothetical protein